MSHVTWCTYFHSVSQHKSIRITLTDVTYILPLDCLLVTLDANWNCRCLRKNFGVTKCFSTNLFPLFLVAARARIIPEMEIEAAIQFA